MKVSALHSPDYGAVAITTDKSLAPHAFTWSSNDLTCRQTVGGSRALYAAESGDDLPLSCSGVEFILCKVAATAIPIRLCLALPHAATCFEGTVNCLDRDGGQMHLQGPGDDIRLPLTATHSAWIINSSGTGRAAAHVAVFDRENRPVAQIHGLRPQCIAWRILLQWLALKERGCVQTPSISMPRVGTRRHAV